MNKLNNLRQLYIDDLTKIVTYYKNPRPRVKHPGKWAKLDSLVYLKKGITEPLDLSLINDDRKVWAISDYHFFHRNIISYSKRPYESVQQMHEHLCANYNKCVDENDICIWGGDVGFRSTEFINELLSKYNGYKILIVGNHDFDGKRLRKLDFDEIHLIYKVDYPEVSMVFTHYPMYNIPEPYINIHGHLHAFPSSDSGHKRHININCEAQEYKPRLLNDIAKQALMIKTI